MIVHQIPKHRIGDDSGDSPVLSEIESQLDQNLLNLFSERIRTSLGRRYAYEVVADAQSNSDTATRIHDVLKDNSELVDQSQQMASRLHQSQPGVSPPGLLIVGLASCDGSPAVVVCKLEHEDAIRVKQTSVNGAKTFDVQHLQDLMLGKNTKVFKASAFVSTDGSLDGVVSDDQGSYDEQGAIATFWLNKFLGCKLKDSSEVSTERFFIVAQQWINQIPDDAQRAEYEIALLAEMNSQRHSITPDSFASNHLRTEHRAAFKQALADGDAPLSRFAKKVRLVEPRLKRIAATFDDFDGRLIAHPDDFASKVKFPADGPVEIHARLKDVRGSN